MNTSQQSSSRATKALPPPPPPDGAEVGVRGRTNPFPTPNRALPTIPRRPVGTQGDNATVPSIQTGNIPPPLPKHGNGAPQLPEIGQTNHIHSLSISSTGSNPSSPQSELWRRRSVKGDK